MHKDVEDDGGGGDDEDGRRRHIASVNVDGEVDLLLGEHRKASEDSNPEYRAHPNLFFKIKQSFFLQKMLTLL